MRHGKLLIGLSLGLLILAPVEFSWAKVIPETTTEVSSENTGLELKAAAAVLMDFTTGEIIYAKDAETARPPASTTKILTALVALERGKPEQMITVSEKASKTEGSSIWLSTGEEHSLEDLLYGVLLSSGNDASVAIAENLAGSETKFAAWMTEKAHSLGANKSNFKNCNGLPNPEHYTTARDLAVIARNALQNPKINQIVSTKKRVIDWPGHVWDRMMINHNKLLWRYEFTDGVKTGYTREAGRCLVSSATKNGHRLISVVLNSKEMYEDSIKLFDYGFENYQLVTLAYEKEKIGTVNISAGVGNSVEVIPEQSVTVLVSRDLVKQLRVKMELPNVVEAPIALNQTLGELEVHLGERLLKKVSLISTQKVLKEKPWVRFWQWMKERFATKKLSAGFRKTLPSLYFPVKIFHYIE